MNRALRQSAKMLAVTAAVMMASGMASGAWAQGRIITVAKTGVAAYSTVQAAVNAANPGDIVEIRDTEVYAEQVTIDGRETSQWPGVTGGKNGITIRYLPPAGTPVNSGFARPTIKYQDITNTSPKSSAEAQKVGELPGQSGNYETCGALRVLSAQGVTIEGIAVDGGGPKPFGWEMVWCTPQGARCETHNHGNAAITLVVSGSTVIRNCDIKNGFFGINVKDRNTGGVFGNPNPADNDATVPLGGFGKSGNHLIEHNRIRDNSRGIFFESAWDLSSTVRYNLIYNNYHISTLRPTSNGGLDGIPNGGNMVAAAIAFKDIAFTPLAIYNNTFYKNANNFLAEWKTGATHLIFNNIFSEPHTTEASYMSVDHRFPNRMHNSVMAAQSGRNGLKEQCPTILDCEGGPPGGCFLWGVSITNSFGSVGTTRINLGYCYTVGGTPEGQQTQDAVVPGALIGGGANMAYTIPAAANVRWLEMTKRTEARLTYDLFESTDPAHAKFLWPKWDDTLVTRFIMNKGWEAAGIRNADGKIADLGAVSSAGGSNRLPAAAARIRPASVVSVNGTQASASFYLDAGAGVFNNPKIKFLRWVSPLPDPCTSTGECNWAGDAGGARAIEIPASAIRDLTGGVSSITPRAGANSIAFTLPAAVTGEYGFFEMVIEGADAAGNAASSDVGFLPYRNVAANILGLAFYPATGAMTAETRLTEVQAGVPVRLQVSAFTSAGAAYTGTLNSLEFTLLSGASASMYRADGGAPLRSVANVRTPVTYDVYFANSGNEQVFAAGASETQAFLGSEAVKVLTAYRLTYAAGANGTISGAASQIVQPGESGTAVTAVPASGYSFIMWSDGVKTPARIDGDVASDISVTAVFGAAGSYALLYAAGAGGRIDGEAAQVLAAGGNGTPVEAVPDAGYAFVKWSDGVKSAARVDGNITADAVFTAEFMQSVSVLTPDRVVPRAPKEEAVVIAPAVVPAGEFAAGPNPVSRSSGAVKFYRTGRRVESTELRVYDATGNVIGKVRITDNAVGTHERRVVGSWDLRDKKGRPVSEGTYLVKGALKMSGGTKERVSVLLGVR